MMTRSRVCALVLVALTGGLALAEEDFLPAESLHRAGLAKFWQLQLPLEANQVLRDAYLVDDQLYLGTQDGHAWAVDALTGVIRWLHPITRSGYRLRRPCHAGDLAVFVTPVDIQVYERRSGAPVERKDLRFPASTGAIADDRRFYVGGLDARLYAFDSADRIADWRLYVGDPVQSTPVLLGDNVYVANERGVIYGAGRREKTFLWRATTVGAVSADLVADENGVYVASRDQSLYLFDLGFGQLRWRARMSSPLVDPPFVAGDLAYQYSASDGIVAVEVDITPDIVERLRWRLPEGRRTLTTDGRLAYILSVDGDILGVDQRNGAIVHTIAANGLELAMPSHDATIFLAAPDGRLFCARPTSVPFLRQEDVLRALRPPRGRGRGRADAGHAAGGCATHHRGRSAARPAPGPAGGREEQGLARIRGQAGRGVADRKAPLQTSFRARGRHSERAGVIPNARASFRTRTSYSAGRRLACAQRHSERSEESRPARE